jgi:RNA polymerase sigma factor (sigma-70 family)
VTERDAGRHVSSSADDASESGEISFTRAAIARLTDDERRVFDQAKFVVDVHSANLCKRFRHVTRAELEQEGYVAMLGSLRRYDPGSGARFSTYCYSRVLGAMIDYATKEAHASLETHVSYQLVADEEVEPDPFEFQDPHPTAVSVLRGRITSFLLKSALAPPPERDPEELLIALARHEAVQHVLSELDEEERAFVKHFYEDEQTLEATGARMGVHKRTATRIHQRLKQRLAPKLVGHGP